MTNRVPTSEQPYGTAPHRPKPRRRAIAGGTVLLPEGRLERREVFYQDGKILALESPAAVDIGALRTEGIEVIDATGCVVAPGFVDTHVHGGQGANFMLGTTDAAATISRHLAAGGVTSCLAGTASTSEGELRDALAGLAPRCDAVPGGIDILGIHLEGPFLSPRYRGVHIREHVRPPSRRELEGLWDVAGESLRVVTLAPELPGGREAIEFFVSRGVVVSVGHSAATYEQTITAVQAGATRATHLWNGLPPIHHREPGPVMALLESTSVHLELVADGQHLAPETVRFTVAFAGSDRAVVVSDGADVAGLPDGPHRRWEGTEVILSCGSSRTAAGGVAGAVLAMDGAVRFLVEQCKISLSTALSMASATPAASIGATSKGSLAPGKDADIVLLDADLHVLRTIARGETIHTKEQQ